jgi:hypothetical protein
MGMKNGHQIGYKETKVILKTLWLHKYFRYGGILLSEKRPNIYFAYD